MVSLISRIVDRVLVGQIRRAALNGCVHYYVKGPTVTIPRPVPCYLLLIEDRRRPDCSIHETHVAWLDREAWPIYESGEGPWAGRVVIQLNGIDAKGRFPQGRLQA